MRATVILSLAALVLGAACGGSKLDSRAPATAPKERHQAAGPGYFLLDAPKGVEIGTNTKGKKVSPKVTKDFAGVPVSNKWWSSLIWQFEPDNPYSRELFAHPLAVRASAEGLGLSYPDQPDVKPREYMHRYSRDFTVGLSGLRAPETRVRGYSDWAVTAEWKGDSATLRATIGHGLPFVYFEREGSAPAEITFEKSKPPRVVGQRANVIAVSIGEHHYGLFAPLGAVWTSTDKGFTSDLAGKGYFSVAILPDDKPATLDFYRQHAYAFVRDTRVSWRYDEPQATVTTVFDLTTEAMEPTLSRDPIVALYRHQWLAANAPFLPGEYRSPRGQMKTLAAARFRTQVKHTGILPMLPRVTEDSSLEALVGRVVDEPEHFPLGLGEAPSHDAYWEGKSFGRLAQAAQIADQLGMKSERDTLLQAMKNELEDWFDGHEPKYFYYHASWCSLVGLPASYGSARELNDHHFHYGYFVQAAAVIARFDPAWAERWAPFVELLIKDAANWQRTDQRFPFLRHMDAYAGHSWANGPSQFAEGNNEEASSEDLNFSSALVLWGATTGNHEVRDLGLYLYTTQIAAVEQYWFDVDRQVFPKGFDHPTAAMVWGAGAKYDTWFDQDPIMIHGINFLPFQGSSLYLGRHPEYVKRNFDTLLERSHGEITTWRDYILMFLATADGKRAKKLFEEDERFKPEFGNSMAMTVHFISNMGELGHVDTSTTADVPMFGVFASDAGKRTYVAYNPDARARKVSFSDGKILEVPARRMAWK